MLVLERIRTKFGGGAVGEKQKLLPVRGVIFYKQKSFVENLRQNFRYELLLNVGFFEYYIEKTTDYCRKICFPGIIILGRTRSSEDSLTQNSFSRSYFSGENILYISSNLKKSVLIGNFVTVEIENNKIFVGDFYSFVKRVAGVLEVQDFIISLSKKKVSIDFFSYNELSMNEIENFFKIFSVYKYSYYYLN